jgi:hypothetical protein
MLLENETLHLNIHGERAEISAVDIIWSVRDLLDVIDSETSVGPDFRYRQRKIHDEVKALIRNEQSILSK